MPKILLLARGTPYAAPPGAAALLAERGLPLSAYRVGTGVATLGHWHALTWEFKETVRARARRDASFRAAILQEAIDYMLAGDTDTGKMILRDYINATVGFDELAAATRKSRMSLKRMLAPSGNPQADNLFAIVAYLQKSEGLRLTTRSARR